ncbi:MAG: sialate O-acetylesterase [Cyclobacteriaceae bacterium]
MKKLIFLACILSTSISAWALRLPAIFSDHMVLQRERPVVIWGWADPGESVRATLNGQQQSTRTDKQGKWKLMLPALKAGGPYELKIAGKKSTLVLHDILIGDVWLASGQSNMEWVLRDTRDADKEIEQANYPEIRHFTVQKQMAYQPLSDLQPASWAVCTPKNAPSFSAVAFFFGRKLYEELHVPIGLINSSWGGTIVETWIDWDVMSKVEPYQSINPAEMEKQMAGMDARLAQYQTALQKDLGETEKWFDPNYNASGWKVIEQPGEWATTPIGDVDGIVWFRKEFSLDGPSDATLSLGPIDDIDVTYINGVRVGSEAAWNKDRLYSIPARLLSKGKNVVVVKVRDDQGGGGMYGKAEQLYLQTADKRISLAGNWQYQTAVVTSDFGVKQTGPNSFPSLLYNAMIAPITSFALKGFIWYQGESNAGEPMKYRTLFASLIRNWRSHWGAELPFYWVQLANYMEPVKQPGQSWWAGLREAQSMTLALPQTGQAVIIDIGEAGDIHPRNKQDVGLRLALQALSKTYGKEIAASGPVMTSWRREGERVVVTFGEVAGGLLARDKYGYVKGFALAGADKKYRWAKGEIRNNTVILSAADVPDPVAVRYAWADNPDDANLYNGAGLPATPFRTDEWDLGEY